MQATESRERTWQEFFDAAGFPELAAPLRVSVRRRNAAARVICVEGWQVATPRGPILMLDDLSLHWGAVLYEHWPVEHRVPVDRYDALVDRRPPVRVPRVRGGRGRIGPTLLAQLTAQPPAAFVHQVLDPDCGHVAVAPYSVSGRLFWIARARWAQELGHPHLAEQLVAQRPDLFDVDDGLRDELARVVLEQAKWNLAQGMSRQEVQADLSRARTLARGRSVIAAIEEARGAVGQDPPRLADPTIDELIEALPDELYFPARRWDPDGPKPSWAGAAKPRSPAWELVARGRDALPALRRLRRTTRWRRQLEPIRATHDGSIRVHLRTADSLYLAVAGAIAGHRFEDWNAFDRWWNTTGQHADAG